MSNVLELNCNETNLVNGGIIDLIGGGVGFSLSAVVTAKLIIDYMKLKRPGNNPMYIHNICANAIVCVASVSGLFGFIAGYFIDDILGLPRVSFHYSFLTD